MSIVAAHSIFHELIEKLNVWICTRIKYESGSFCGNRRFAEFAETTRICGKSCHFHNNSCFISRDARGNPIIQCEYCDSKYFRSAHAHSQRTVVIKHRILDFEFAEALLICGNCMRIPPNSIKSFILLQSQLEHRGRYFKNNNHE